MDVLKSSRKQRCVRFPCCFVVIVLVVVVVKVVAVVDAHESLLPFFI